MNQRTMKKKSCMGEISEETAQAYYEAYTERELKRLREIVASLNSLDSCNSLHKLPKPFYIIRILNKVNQSVQSVFINLFH